MSNFHKLMSSPLGKLTLVANERSLIGILWENDLIRRTQMEIGQLVKQTSILQAVEIQLLEYFDGKRHDFDLPIEFEGTPFQTKVWRALQRIPYGETRSYSELASEIGSPNAYRAVGTANGRNPISIVVPCHRVIGASGDLAGFAGGLDAKAFLLNLEVALK